MTGDRTILPIAAAWAPSENSIYTEKLIKMMPNEISLIEACHTDQAMALFKCFEKVGIFNHLCLWHLTKHCSSKKIFRKLVSASNSHEYSLIKHKIKVEHKKLYNELTNKDIWQKISRFECLAPRDQSLATSSVESLNAFIKKMGLKNREPLTVFLQIYEFGYTSLQKICAQTNYFTNSVSNWLSYALTVAHQLTVCKTKFDWERYEVVSI